MRHLILLGLLLTVPSLYATDDVKEVDEFHSVLSSLLNVNQVRYTYVDAQGQRKNDALKMFKEMESIYIKYIKPDLPDGRHSEKRLKVLMLFAFYAEKNNSAAFLEYLAADMVPIYHKNRKTFLKGLNELAYMIPATCGRLNAHFGHEGKNANKKKYFIKINKKIIIATLKKENAQICMREFNK